MSEQQPAVENVSRGTAVTIAIIPIAIVLYAVVGAVNVIVLFVIAAGFIPAIAHRLYTRGAGAQLSRAGWKPFITLTSIALILGIFTGLVFRTFASFSSVNPRLGLGGLLTPAFWTTFGRNLEGSNSGDLLIQGLLALAVGAVAIVGVVRGQVTARAKSAAPQQPPFGASESIPPLAPNAAGFAPAQGATPAAPPAAPPAYGTPPAVPPAHAAAPQSAPPTAPGYGTAAAPSASVPPVAQPTPPPRTAIINPTSSGVLLNGKPIDDQGKKKK